MKHKSMSLRLSALLAVALLLLGCFSACGSAENTSVDDAQGYGSVEEMSAMPENRKLIRNAQLSLETKSFDATYKSIQEQVEELEGYIESSDSYGTEYRELTLTIRVPAEKLDVFLSRAGELGAVTHKKIETTDVTSEYVDVESRLNALKTEQEALTQLLAQAKSLDDILSVRDRLAEVTGELESYQAQLNLYDSQVAYSTVTMTVDEVEVESEGEGFFEEIGTRFVNNSVDIGLGLRDFAVWLISATPYLLLFGLIGLGIFLFVLARIRRHRRK